MSSRPQALYPVIVNGNMTTTITSQVSIIQKLSMMSYALSWVGTTPVGSASVQVSNDYSQNEDGTVKNPGTWNTVPVSLSGSSVTLIPISGSTGNGFIDIDEMGAYAMRLVYTPTSGTGTLQATYNAKVA
jgi:hypothetical protein